MELHAYLVYIFFIRQLPRILLFLFKKNSFVDIAVSGGVDPISQFILSGEHRRQTLLKDESSVGHYYDMKG